MVNKLNNTNGKGSNAVINKQIKDLQDDVSCLRTDVNQNTIDIAAIDAALDTKVSKSSLAAEVDTASLKAGNAKIDFIESKDEDDVSVNDNLNVNGNISTTGKVSATAFEANGVDIVNDYTCKYADAAHEACIAKNVAGQSMSIAMVAKDCIDSYKAQNLCSFGTKDFTAETVTATCSTCSKTLTVTDCADLPDTTIQTIRNGTKLLSRFFEPTVKDPDDYYHIKLPGDFIGNASFVGIDEFGDVLFSAEIITRTDDLSEGTALIVHSGKSIYDFYQVLRDLETKRVSFITKSNVKRIYFSYDNYDKDAEPTYDIYPDLSAFPYTDYESIYTAAHSSQTVVLGNENTLNGGMTVVGVLTAAIDSSGQPMITDNIYIKQHIFAGYNSDTGSYESQGKQGDILTMNNCSTTGICTPHQRLNWIKGCPRQLARKGVCLCEDSQHNECSDLQFESPTDNDTYATNLSNTSDAIITERSVANWSGIVEDDSTPAVCSYPITHLGDTSCVHGSIEVEDNITVCCDATVCHDLTVCHDTTLCNVTATGNTQLHNLEVDTRIEAKGDIRAKGEMIAEKDLVVHGDLYVDGAVTSTEEKQVTTSGNYIVAREGAANGLTSTEYAGLVVNNYDGNGCNATILSDCSGEFRVADQSYTSCVTYNDISEWNGCFYQLLTTSVTTGPTHILSDVDAVELSNVVFNSTAGTETCADSYYHFEGTEWYGPLSIVSGHFDLGSVVTDATDIATLDALTRDKLIYFNSVTDKEVSGLDQNQPIATRNEAGNMSHQVLVCWDACYRRLDAIGNNPTLSDQVLVSCVNTGHPAGTLTTYKYNGTEYTDTTLSTTASIPTYAGTPVQALVKSDVVVYNDTVYYTDGVDWFLLADGTQVTDATVISALEAETTHPLYQEDYTWYYLPDDVHYCWETKKTGVVAFCGTYACLQAALLIPEGQPGYIPPRSQVIVTDRDNSVYSSNQ